MIQATDVEKLLEAAIGALVSSGYPCNAEHLRPNLKAIASAPTAAAKRRRTLHLVEMLDRSAPEARYRSLLDRIHEAIERSGKAS
jgi:hypothetical protein